MRSPAGSAGAQSVQLDALRRRVAELEARTAALRQEDDASQRGEARFRALVETASDWIWETDREGVYTYASPKVRDLLGYEPCEVVGRTPYDFMPPEEARRVGQIVAACWSAATPISGLENWNLRKDGSRVLLETSGAPFFDAAGNLQGYRGIDRDITERKRAEQVDARFRAFVETTNEWIWSIDLRGQHTFCNPALRTILGYEPEEFTDHDALDYLHEEDRPVVQQVVAEGVARKAGWSGLVLRWRHRDGSYRHLESTAVPILDASGHVTGFSGADRDVTERRQAEQERRQLETQMLQAQKLESLGVLAGGIAHDFNNLLTAILGHASLALFETAPESRARDNLREIENASRRAAELCRQMLAYAGRGRLVVEPVDLSRLVQELVHLLHVSISKKALLRCQLADDLPTIEADPVQVRQIVMNLVINASEAIGDDDGVIDITTRVLECGGGPGSSRSAEALPPGRYVCLEVTDTGCGMDAETQAKIFDPFFTTKFTGRGLGLAAVLGVVRRHMGEVRVVSERGKGTTFRILFPAGAASAAQPEAGAAPSVCCGTGTILLVDDEEPVRQVAAMMLEHCGFRVLIASDGREALALFRRHQAEIAGVLLDLTMPHMDGEQTFRELRRLQPDVRVILASGYSDSEVMRRFADEPLAGALEKPYQLQSLCAKLREVLAPGPGRPTT